jgi:NAD(P)-dependent dehydrogenase (short-subunit alcohol dehydrogenase family)
VVCDVRDPARVASLIDTVFAHYGRVDVLVNNAAGNFISPTERLSHRAVDAVLNIVLHGTFYCTLEVGKRWIAAGTGGVMLNIVTNYASSGAGSAYVVPSAAAKAGVLALTRSLAVEWAPHGIRQVAIAPGPFPTPGAWERLVPTRDVEALMRGRVPGGRLGEHGELANLASFLISDFAGYINGEVITIDGGEWLQGAGEFNFLRALSAEQWDEVARRSRGS